MGTFNLEPSNEMQTREWFAAHLNEFEYSIVGSGSTFPDYVLEDQCGHKHRVEVESESGNFVSHGHDPQQCDFVLCWKHTQALPLPVLELSSGIMHPPNTQATAPREVPYSPPDIRARRAAQSLRDKANKMPDRLGLFYEALAGDMRAKSAYQSALVVPRLALLQVTRELLAAIGEANMDPYDLLQILTS